MHAASPTQPLEPRTNPFTSADVESILLEKGWLRANAERDDALAAWLELAATLLGPQAADRAALADLLELIFHYNAAEALSDPASYAVLSREGARSVIRELALAVLEGPLVDSSGFKKIIDRVKSNLHFGSRELFLPLRLALAGRAGGGELDRVVLLLDSASVTCGLAPVKDVRTRMMEFCMALD
jgi:hypothetical protein